MVKSQKQSEIIKYFRFNQSHDVVDIIASFIDFLLFMNVVKYIKDFCLNYMWENYLCNKIVWINQFSTSEQKLT